MKDVVDCSGGVQYVGIALEARAKRAGHSSW